ncbi:hypothetical protein Hanom_Chr09g00818401 [Helianthus anomalus]
MSFLAGSPLTTGVLVSDGLQFRNVAVVNAAQQYGMVQYANAPGVVVVGGRSDGLGSTETARW